MKQTLYYIEAYSRLSQQRERVSGYSSQRDALLPMFDALMTVRPRHRLYLRPSIKTSTLSKAKKQ